MKNLWFPLVVVGLALTGCSTDRTLDSLIPKTALAVVLIDHPSQLAQTLGSGAGDLPLTSLDGNKPWAAAALPANPPGFLLALALSDQPGAWPAVQAWARDRGGLDAVRFGTYAVLTSPGLPAPALLDASQRFDLARVRAGGDPLEVYIDMHNVMAEADLPPGMRPIFSALPWAEKNLSGLRLGFTSRDGGLEARLATDWKPGSDLGTFWKGAKTPVDLGSWTGLLPSAPGIGAVLSLPPSLLAQVPWTGDAELTRRWAALAPLVGPRAVVWGSPESDGTWAWSLALEAQDPQAVRQALKTLVASGDLQRHFTDWAMDADTPLIYQDRPDGRGGVQTQITLGTAVFHLGYGRDRVTVAGGPGAPESLTVWNRSAVPASWYQEAPGGALLVASGAIDGLGARAAFRVLDDGNVELRAWVAASDLRAWEERLPQAALTWLSGPGGWTRAEP